MKRCCGNGWQACRDAGYSLSVSPFLRIGAYQLGINNVGPTLDDNIPEPMPERLFLLPHFVVSSCFRYNGLMSRSHSGFSSFAWALFLSLVVLMAGCESKQGPKYPEDHERFGRVVEAVDALRSAYEKQNLDAIRKLMLPSKGFQRLQREMQQDFATSSAIALTMTIERMYVQGEQARVNIRWEGEWQPSSEDKVVTDRGHGILIWSGTQVILLAGVEGDLPFGMASR